MELSGKEGHSLEMEEISPIHLGEVSWSSPKFEGSIYSFKKGKCNEVRVDGKFPDHQTYQIEPLPALGVWIQMFGDNIPNNPKMSGVSLKMSGDDIP